MIQLSIMYEKLLNIVITKKIFPYENFFAIFPKLELLKTTPQDKVYHAEGDVWTHTKMCCDSLINLPEYNKANNESKFVMFYAALLHDIAKPICTKQEDNGSISSKGHSKKGAIDVRIDLWKKNIPFHLRERICNIINVHQVPFFAFKTQKTPEFLSHLLAEQTILNELITVAKADMLGRTSIHRQSALDDIALFEIIAQEQNCLFQKKQFPNLNTKIKYFNSNGIISSDYEFFKENGSHVYVMSGIPASGKNHWISQNMPNLPMLSFDSAKEELGLKHGENDGKAAHLVIDRAKDFLRNKKNFIFNATHLSKQMRDKTLSLLYNYDAFVSMIYKEVSYEEILKRNNQRNTTLSNKKIEEMLLKWEVPTSDEAHEVIFCIDNTTPKFKKRI